MALHALELLPDAEGQAAVRRDWQALRDAGLPSQLDHRGATNAPHLTIASGPVMDTAAVAVARDLLVPLLPIRVRAAGLLLLGGPRLTLARAVDMDDGVLAAVLSVRAAVGVQQHVGWLPHLTLARRLPRHDAQRAVDVLGHEDVELLLVELRRWDPDAGAVTSLTDSAP